MPEIETQQLSVRSVKNLRPSEPTCVLGERPVAASEAEEEVEAGTHSSNIRYYCSLERIQQETKITHKLLELNTDTVSNRQDLVICWARDRPLHSVKFRTPTGDS